ncbi:MAG TPA: methyltransferase [Caulobacteraceae bacterium]|jgi:predicted methyltransferase|nr:methyltransferase [Caulobacteraceae bacterium]
MKTSILLAASAASMIAAGAAAAPMIPDYVSAAVADSHRPDVDTARDANRKPAEVLAFSEVKPGDKVFEILPSKGYFTRLFSKAVGPTGHVYAVSPTVNPETGAAVPPMALIGDPAYPNVSPVPLSFASIKSPEPVDIVFTAQNYHDFHLARFKADVVALDRQLFADLKPGGLLIIEDHAAEAGSGLRDPDKLHRIDEAVVKQEVESAGFKLVAESDVLHNPADPHTALVFDPAIRGHTDQFVLKFRKPG